MVGLQRNSNGSWSARKRLPNDVRDEYAALYGPRLEAKFYAAVGTTPPLAKQQFNEWLAETEGRIRAIRAAHNGEGTSLTQRQARGLAGEWYEWFVARHPLRNLRTWEDLRDHIHDAYKEAVGEERWEGNDPTDLWWEDEDLRKEMRPVLADVGETAQFLAAKGLTLNRVDRTGRNARRKAVESAGYGGFSIWAAIDYCSRINESSSQARLSSYPVVEPKSGGGYPLAFTKR